MPNLTLFDASVFRMLTEAFAFHPFVLILLVGLLCFFVYKKYPLSKSLLYIISIWYGFLFIEFMLLPFTGGDRRIGFQLIPFGTLRDVLLPNWSQDIEIFRFVMGLLALIPLGFLLPFFRPALSRWKDALIFAFLIAFGVECAQIFVTFIFGGSRVFDVDDILLGMIGFLFGFAAWKMFTKLFPKQINRT